MRELFGLHGTTRAKPGQRAALLAILVDASLTLESVRETIGRARPLIAGGGTSTTFHPVAGV